MTGFLILLFSVCVCVAQRVYQSQAITRFDGQDFVLAIGIVRHEMAPMQSFSPSTKGVCVGRIAVADNKGSPREFGRKMNDEGAKHPIGLLSVSVLLEESSLLVNEQLIEFHLDQLVIENGVENSQIFTSIVLLIFLRS